MIIFLFPCKKNAQFTNFCKWSQRNKPSPHALLGSWFSTDLPSLKIFKSFEIRGLRFVGKYCDITVKCWYLGSRCPSKLDLFQSRHRFSSFGVSRPCHFSRQERSPSFGDIFLLRESYAELSPRFSPLTIASIAFDLVASFLISHALFSSFSCLILAPTSKTHMLPIFVSKHRKVWMFWILILAKLL